MTLVTRLRNFNLLAMQNSDDLDEGVSLVTEAEALRDGYKRRNLSSPEWLDDAIRSLDRFIGDRLRDTLELERRTLLQDIAAGRSREEKRKIAEDRLAEIEAKLGREKTAV